MSYVYGRMKISITGRNFKDWFLRDFDSAIRGAKPVTR